MAHRKQPLCAWNQRELRRYGGLPPRDLRVKDWSQTAWIQIWLNVLLLKATRQCYWKGSDYSSSTCFKFPKRDQKSKTFQPICWASNRIITNHVLVTQTHVHRVSDAIQPSHLLSSPSPPAPNPSQHQGLFQWVNSAWGGQSIGVSTSASVLPMNTQDWSPLGLTGWISLQSKGLSRVFSNTIV